MKNKKLNYLRMALAAVLLLTGISARAQATFGADSAPQDFSMLEIVSNGTGGVRLPQLTSKQRDALAVRGNALARGLVIYNTDVDCMEYWNGSNWVNTCGVVSLAIRSAASSPAYNNTGDADRYTDAVLAVETDDEKNTAR